MASEDDTPRTEEESPDAQAPDADVAAEQAPDAPEVSEDSSPAPVAAQSEADAPASDPEPAPQSAVQEEAPAEASPGRPAAKRKAEAENPTPAAVPGAHLEIDIVPEGVDPLAAEPSYGYGEDDQEEGSGEQELIEETVAVQPIEQVAIDLAAGARYHATGKRKTAIARVILRPGSGTYTINGRSLEAFFPRETLQRNIRQPLETVGYEERMDVIARLQGGGVSAQAGALRHGISRALLEADPNLRGELKRRGFLTRDARAKERKKAGLKKARKRPQFSKR
jgi:small subunit ribosomal protein S9